MTSFARAPLYRRHRFPADVIAHAVWLYFRFPLSLRMVEDLLAARGINVSHQTVRLWAEKFGRHFANDIRKRSAGRLGEGQSGRFGRGRDCGRAGDQHMFDGALSLCLKDVSAEAAQEFRPSVCGHGMCNELSKNS